MRLLNRFGSTIAAALLLIGWAGPVWAGPITLSIPGREDYVFDNSGILYITDGSNIDRYNTQTNSFLTPFQVGGSLLASTSRRTTRPWRWQTPAAPGSISSALPRAQSHR